MREFVTNPETGKVAVAITTYQDIESELLESTLNDAVTAKENLVKAKLEAFNASLEQDEEVVAAEKAVTEAKSELEQYESLTPTTAGVDDGTDGSSSESPDGSELVEADTTVI